LQDLNLISFFLDSHASILGSIILLQKVDVLVNSLVLEAGVLNNSLQIVVIWEDLVYKAHATINLLNEDCQLEMEAVSCGLSWMFGCTEHLLIKIGDLTFFMLACVVKHAPFPLLLGHPFHHLLLC
jgi:hypothetical protein